MKRFKIDEALKELEAMCRERCGYLPHFAP